MNIWELQNNNRIRADRCLCIISHFKCQAITLVKNTKVSIDNWVKYDNVSGMRIDLVPPRYSTVPDFWKGYTIEKNPSTENDQTPYIIRKGNKNWLLMRNVPNPRMMFPMPETMSTNLKIKGIGWFEEIVNGDVIEIKPR